MVIQTKVTPLVRREMMRIKGEKLDFIISLLKYLKENYRLDKNLKKRTRSADELIKSKVMAGCTDYAHLFIAICRAKKIPVKYIETLDKDWIKKPNFEKVRGHIFVKINLDENIFLIDPFNGDVNVTNNYKNYYPIGEGDDFRTLYASKEIFYKKIKEFLNTINLK